VPSVTHKPRGGKMVRNDLYAALTSVGRHADLVLWWQPQNGVSIEALDALRGRVPLAMMSMDDPFVFETEYCANFSEFELAVTCCDGATAWYQSRDIVPLVGYPPCDRDLHGAAVPDPDRACDFLFAATNTYPGDRFTYAVDRCDIVRAVADLGTVHLYGYWGVKARDWHRLGDRMKHLWKGWLGYEAHPGVMAAARINLNSHVRPDGYRYLNERVTLAMASGGFHLCDRVSGIEELFDEGREIVLWDDLADLADKACYYLAHDRARRNVAALGRRKALAMFDNERLARRILEVTGARR